MSIFSLNSCDAVPTLHPGGSADKKSSPRRVLVKWSGAQARRRTVSRRAVASEATTSPQTTANNVLDSDSSIPERVHPDEPMLSPTADKHVQTDGRKSRAYAHVESQVDTLKPFFNKKVMALRRKYLAS